MSKEKTKLLDKPFVHKLLGTDPSQPEEMQPKEVLSYSFAGFGQNLICALVTSFFLFFLTDGIGFNPLWLAWMFLGARLFDAFNDPIMGTIVDRTRTKDGKMRPYLKAMPIPIAIFTVLLFIPYTKIIPNQAGAFALATIIYVTWSVLYTIVDVPYWGLASSMTKDTDKRNTMLTVARLLCTIGAGIVTVFLPAIQGIIESTAINDMFVAAGLDGSGIGKDMIEKAAEGVTVITQVDGMWQIPVNLWNDLNQTFMARYQILYIVAAAVIGIASIPTFYVGYLNTKERYYEEESNKSSLGHNVKLLGKNRPIILLILVGVLGCLRLIYMTSGIYYAKYNCDNVGLFSIMTLLVVPGGLIATLTTPYLSRKFGKRNVFLYSHLVGGIAMLIVYFVGIPDAGSSQLSQILFFIVLVLLGIPSGFSNILQYSMIADSIDYLEDKTGERAEGICFSMQTFISKIGMAFTAFTTLLVLGISGYANADKLVADDKMKSKIWMMTTLFAAISTIACCIPLFFYTFTEKRQMEAVERITQRKAAKVSANKLCLAAETALNSDSYTADNKNELIDAVAQAKESLAKVFLLEDVNSIVDSLTNKDSDFFNSLEVTDSKAIEDAKEDSVEESEAEKSVPEEVVAEEPAKEEAVEVETVVEETPVEESKEESEASVAEEDKKDKE